MRMTLIVVLTLLIGLGFYVRVAPSHPEDWHAMPEEVEDKDMTDGVMRVLRGVGLAEMARLHGIVVASPRTRVLAGSVEEGMVTYVSRSRVFGFPDYTTMRLEETRIEIHGRLRFGLSDMGVNGARIDAWLMRFSEGG